MDSPEHFAEIESIAQEATAFITERAAQRAEGERLAVILDIDETSVSNFPHIHSPDFGNDSKHWDIWLHKCACPAITPVLEMYRAALANDIAILFLSGRRENLREPTVRNLVDAGYTGYSALILKADDSTESAAEWKARERAQLAREGWTIIACIGDQESDLAGGNTGCAFKIPNPIYFVK